jgi:hypothetical protein
MKAPLGQRLFEGGNPNPAFALMGSLNWMRSLALLTQATDLSAKVDEIARKASWKRERDPNVQDVAFEKLFLAQSYRAAVQAMTAVENPNDVARAAIVSWYYCTYFASQAMLAVAGQSVPEEHARTARVWLNQFVSGPSRPLVPYPFDLCVSTLVKKAADTECVQLRRETGQNVNTRPATVDEAHDAHVSYLKGSAGFYREKEEGKIRSSREFSDGGYSDFRKKDAREHRDRILAKRSVGFLDMAIRYRGKANYRDAIFLCYGNAAPMADFVNDAASVANAYYRMAERWVSHRLPLDDWTHFLEDLQSNSKLTKQE